MYVRIVIIPFELLGSSSLICVGGTYIVITISCKGHIIISGLTDSGEDTGSPLSWSEVKEDIVTSIVSEQSLRTTIICLFQV